MLIIPFAFSELSARVRALLRQRRVVSGLLLKVADLELNRVERTVQRSGSRIELTSKEFGLLEALVTQCRPRFDAQHDCRTVWNLSFDTWTNVVDVYINYLRKIAKASG